MPNFVLQQNWLSNSLEQSFSKKASSCSYSQEIPNLWTVVSVPRRFCFISSKTFTSYLTPRKRVFLEKRIVAQLLRKPPSFYGIWKFISLSQDHCPCLYSEPLQFLVFCFRSVLYTYRAQNGVWFFSAAAARKALPYDQYLENFSRYVAEIHAVFSGKFLLESCFTKKSLEMVRFQLVISELMIIPAVLDVY